MSLYKVNSGDLPMASDVNQFADVFLGNHDVGNIYLAPTLSPPNYGSFSVATSSGSGLGVGTYQYVFTSITGYYQSNGTLKKTGETLQSSPALSVTTTSGNQSVTITLPSSFSANSIIATCIYRTAVGGSSFAWVGTVRVGATSFVDNVADTSRGSAPPSTNTTGTNISLPGNLSMPNNPANTVAGTNTNLTMAANTDTLLTFAASATPTLPGEANWSNGAYTATVDGYYLVYSNVRVTLPLNSVADIKVFKYSGGTGTFQFNIGRAYNANQSATQDITSPGVGVVHLAVGESIKLYINATNASTTVNMTNCRAGVIKVG